ARDTPKFSAAQMYWRSMVCTAAAVCTIVGNTDDRKIRKIGDTSPTPNHRMAMGIQAIGEMGRRIWTMGFNVANAPLTHPIKRPNGIATTTASKKPAPTLNSDEPM